MSLRSTFWLGLATLLAFGLFFATRSAVHSWDSIAYVARSNDDPLLSEKYLSTSRFHPHHVLYVPLAQATIRAVGERAGPGPYAPLLFLSCVAGALCVGIGGWVAWRVAETLEAGLATAAFLALANATWLYATTIEVMMPALCVLFAGLALLTFRSLWIVPVAGLVVAGSVLLHQIAVFYAAVLTLTLVTLGVRRALLFAIFWVPPVVAGYVWAAYTSGAASSLAGVVAWSLAAAPRSQSASIGYEAAVYQAVRTAAEAIVSLVPVTRLRAGASPTPALWIGAGAVTVVGVLVVLGWIRALRAAPPDRSSPKRAVSDGLLWGSLVTALFICWFQARTIDYWVYVVAGFGVWAFGRLRFVPRKTLLVCLLLLGGTNLYFRVLAMRDARNAPYAPLVAFAEQQLQRGDHFWLAPADSALQHALVLYPFEYGIETEIVGPADAGESPTVLAALEWARGGGRLFSTDAARREIRRADVQEWAWMQAGTIGETEIYRLDWSVPRAATTEP